MRDRARRIGRALWRGIATIRRGIDAIGRGITRVIGRDELTLAGGVVLVTVALWPILGRLALLPAGIVLIWIGLPSRTRFVVPFDGRRRKPE